MIQNHTTFLHSIMTKISLNTIMISSKQQGLFQERRKVDFPLRNAAFRAFVWRCSLFCFPQQRFTEKISIATVP